MIEELANLFDIFPGKANQMCCFLHILNLIAKSIIKQFDLLKAASDAFLDETTQELLELAGDLDLQEKQSHDEDKNDEEDNNEDGLVDECELMSEWKREELDVSIQSVRLLLTKVSHSG